MSEKRLSDVVRRWVYRIRQADGRPARAGRRLGVHELEPRFAPATLTTPTVTATSAITSLAYDSNQAGRNFAFEAYNASSAMDPLNAQHIVTAATRVYQDNSSDILFQYSTNGGASFTALNLAVPSTDVTQNADSSTYFPVSLPQVSAPSVGFATDGTVYIAFTQNTADKTSGRVAVTSVSFPSTGTAPATPTAASTKFVYKWVGLDPALNPTVGVNDDPSSYTDPDTGVVYTDPLNNRNSGTNVPPTPVYVAWNSNGTATTNGENLNGATRGSGASVFDPNAIFAVATYNQGTDFTPPLAVNSSDDSNSIATGYFPGTSKTGGAAPAISFLPVQSGTTGGRLMFTWSKPVASSPATAPTSTISYDLSNPAAPGGTAIPSGKPLAYSATAKWNGSSPTINDTAAATSGADQPTPTSFYTAPITFTGTGSLFNSLTALSTTIAIQDPDPLGMTDYKIELVSPAYTDANGAHNGTAVTLLQAAIDGNGTAYGTPVGAPYQIGLPGAVATLGGSYITVYGQQVFVASGATFSDDGARKINDPLNTTPYVGFYRPEVGSLMNTYGSFTAAQLSGQWELRITDVRADRLSPPLPVHYPPTLKKFEVNFASGVVDGFSTTNNTVTNAVTVAAPIDWSSTANAATAPNPVLSPNLGYGPSVSVAVDNSLGSHSPTFGKVYIAYTARDPLAPPNGNSTTNTNIKLQTATWGVIGFDQSNAPIYGLTWGTAVQVNDDAETDNVTTGLRTQFMPAITVDNATGTLVATWYDARLDASNARPARYITTSIDGGATFSPQTFVNTPHSAIDAITGKTVVLGPEADNEVAADDQIANATAAISAHGFGFNQSVLAYNGNAVAFWTGNQNNPGANIYRAQVVYAAGPRVVYGDTGSVTANRVVTGYRSGSTTVSQSYTVSSVDANGVRTLNGFVVTFDRPVNPATFTGSDVTATFLSAITGQSITLPVAAYVVPISTGAGSYYNVTSFFVQFANPQTAVGSYSYAVGPDMKGWVYRPDVPTSPVSPTTVYDADSMDQNANGATEEASGDRFGIDGAASATLYAGSPLPLILPGPRLVGVSTTATNGTTTLAAAPVLNTSASTVRVTFNQAIDATTFTAAQVISVTGPVGPVAGPFTVTADPTDPRSFTVGFPTQVLSGTYTVVLGSGIKALIAGATVDQEPALDTNQNAGVYILNGVDTSGTAAYVTNTYATTGAAVAIPAYGTASLPLTVTDAYQIKQLLGSTRATSQLIQVALNISFPNDPDLQADLIAPDGTDVRLFTGVGQANSTRGSFSNTLFDDLGTTPIQTAIEPFSSGPYTPQFPLSALSRSAPDTPVQAQGTWYLKVTNTGSYTGSITNWRLTLPHTVNGTGLGEPIADRATATFNIFNQDPTNALTKSVWTSVGPTSVNQTSATVTNAGRVNTLAIDPSDPSGNTAYVGGATGGVWRTTNYLTTNPAGPTWTPLTDLGSGFSLNIASIVLIPVNNDPAQTIVFALTGAGGYPAGNGATNPTTPGTAVGGVGILRSTDGGKSWKILDSTNNADSTGNILPIDAPQGTTAGVNRDRLFFDANGFKIIADPTPLPNGEHILYMAVSGTTAQAGVWRSLDTGKSWVRIQAGNATDVALSAGSYGANGNLLRLYAAFTNGAYVSEQAPTGFGMTLMIGSGGYDSGNALIRQGSNAVPVGNPSSNDPTGGGARYVLAAPAATNSPELNSFYRDWLYVLEIKPDGTYGGLFVTKDDGANWTRIAIPYYADPTYGTIWGSNNETTGDVDLFAGQNNAGAQRIPNQQGVGNQTASLALDPTNPNILYLGGITAARIDATAVNTPQTFVYYDYGAGGVGAQTADNSSGGVVALGTKITDPRLLVRGSATSFHPDNYLNLSRDPDNPFGTGTTLRIQPTTASPNPPGYNVASFTDNGQNAQWTPFTSFLTLNGYNDFSDLTAIVPTVDPTTGKVRVNVGTRYGVLTGVDSGLKAGTGTLVTSAGFTTLASTIRNGNLQLEQFYAGAVQPSVLAADVAGALFYGMSQDNGYPVSASNVLQTGDLNWTTEFSGDQTGKSPRYGSDSTGVGVAVDQTGTGTAYQYRLPCCYDPGSSQTLQPTDFFRVFLPGTAANGAGQSQTIGLVQGTDNPGADVGNWPKKDTTVGDFVVSPRDGDDAIIGSRLGNIYGTVDLTQANNVRWNLVASAGQLDGTIPHALAYGAPNTGDSPTSVNFLYAGTTGGKVFITQDGGGSWTNITGNLPANAGILQIVADPRTGTDDAFAVTSSGVYYLAHAKAATPTWVDVTANLFQLRKPVFGDANTSALAAGGLDTNLPYALKSITAIAADWRYTIPVNPANPTGATFPVLYVAGDGGVFRSANALQTGGSWAIYPALNTTLGTPAGGYLPSALVTDLDLSTGNIDPLTGLPKSAGALDLLVASTWGRGSWAIRLDNSDVSQYLVSGDSGPRVVGLNEITPAGGASATTTTLAVRFDEPVDPTKFDGTDVTISYTDGNGNPVTITGSQITVTPVVNAIGGSQDQRNLFDLTFATPAGGARFYKVTIGPNVTDFAGRMMNQNADTKNGDTTVAAATGGPADAYVGQVYLSGTGAAAGGLFIDLPESTTAGSPTAVTVTAGRGTTVTVNGVTYQSGDADPNYTRTVNLTTSDPNAVITSNYTFTGADAGSKTLTFTFNTGSTALPYAPTVQTVSVTDSAASGAYNPATASILVHGGPATHFTFTSVPAGVTAGVPFQVTLTARDGIVNANRPDGNIADLYTGLVDLSSSDAQNLSQQFPGLVGLPAQYQFTAADHGSHTFTVELFTVGTQTVTAQDDNHKIGTAGAISGTTSTVVAPSVASSFKVTPFTPNPEVAGTAATVRVTAYDAFGNVATGYNGTVSFTSSDAQATAANGGLPAAYTFKSDGTTVRSAANDLGYHDFAVTLKTAGPNLNGTVVAPNTGNESVTATGTAQSPIAGAATPGPVTGTGQQTVVPAAADHLTFGTFAPNPVVAGAPTVVTVTARDPFGNVAINYKGAVHFTSTDPLIAAGSGLPADYTFTSDNTANHTGTVDDGYHAFTVVPRTAGPNLNGGPETVTATDKATASITGAGTVTVTPAAATSFTFGPFLPNPEVAGTPTSVTITARDTYGNVATGYTGTVHFTSTDPQSPTLGGLPADYTFTSDNTANHTGTVDDGYHSFALTLWTVGTQTVTATDTATSTTTGSGSVAVVPATAASLTLSPITPNPVVAGAGATVTLTAKDKYGNVATGYAGTVHFTSPTDAQVAAGAGLPADYTFTTGAGGDAGVHTFTNGVTFKTAGASRTGGTETLTVTDTVNAALTASASDMVVPAAVSSFAVAGFPSPIVAGTSGAFTVTALDAYGNIAVGFLGAVQFTSTDPKASLPAVSVFTTANQGVRTFTAVLETAGSQAITVSDGTHSGSQTGIIVTPAAATQFVMTGLPAAVTAGAPTAFTLTAEDPYGNVATGYAGLVRFASTDPKVVLVSDYVYKASDAGVRTFQVTFKTAGTQTVTAADATTATMTASETTAVAAAGFAGFTVTGLPAATTAGTPASVTVAASDAYGNAVAGYTGTVGFTSTDPQATAGNGLPAGYTFTAADGGTHTFAGGVTLKTAGPQTVAVTDAADSSKAGGQTSVVSPAAATHFTVAGFPSPTATGATGTFTVTALDAYGNVATGFAGLVRFTSSDPQATAGAGLPVNYTFTAADAGSHTFAATLKTVGTQSITATAAANPAVTGSDAGIAVTSPPPPATNTPPTIAGVAGQIVPYNSQSAALPFTVGDLETPAAALTVTATSTNPALLPVTGIVFGGSGANRTVTLTPAANAGGSSVVTLTVTDGSGATATDTFQVTVPPPPGVPPVSGGGGSTGGGSPLPPPGISNGAGGLATYTAVGTGAGGNVVTVYGPDGSVIRQLQPYGSTFTGGTRVAIARTPSGDRLVVAPGPGPSQPVLVYDVATGALIQQFQPFETSFQGGEFVTAGDLDGDGYDDYVVTPDEGGGPRVRVYSGQTGNPTADFFGIADPTFFGGVRAAVGDVNGDGHADLIVSAGFGGGPRVAIFDGTTISSAAPQRLVGDFFVFEQSLRNGVYVTTGDINGDGKADIIVGGGPGGGPRVQALDAASLLANQTKTLFDFFAGNTDNRGGVRIAVKDVNQDGVADLVTGDGDGAGSHVTVYSGKDLLAGNSLAPLLSFDDEPGLSNGVYVG